MSQDHNEFEPSQQQPQQYGEQPQGGGQPQQFGQAPYGGQPQQFGQGGLQAEDPGKTFGIIGFILAFVAAPAGIVLSYMSKKKSRAAGYPVSALAKWGFILGIVFTIFIVLYIIAAVALVIFASQSGYQPR